MCGPSACVGCARESAGHLLSEDFEISLAQANSGVNESELPKIFLFNCLHTYSVVDQNRNQRH